MKCARLRPWVGARGKEQGHQGWTQVDPRLKTEGKEGQADRTAHRVVNPYSSGTDLSKV